MEKGLFYDVTVIFNFQTETHITNAEFILNDKNNIFRTSEPIYKVNVSQQLKFQLLLGVICSTQLKTADLEFVPINTDSTGFESTIYSITIEDPKIKTKLSLNISSPTITKGEYGIAYLSEYPLNVDDVLIKLNSSNPSLGFDMLFTIPTYNPKVLSNKIYGKYWLKPDEPNQESSSTVEISFAIEANLQCFELLNDSFTLNFGENALQDTKEKTVDFKYEISETDVLTINIGNYIIPSNLFCVLTSKKLKDPTESDLINQDYYHLLDNSTTRYFKTFLYQTMRTLTFSFDHLTIEEDYKLCCVLQNSAHDQSLLTTSKIFYNTVEFKKKDEEHNKGWIIAISIVIPLIVIAIAGFFIYRYCKKKQISNLDTTGKPLI